MKIYLIVLMMVVSGVARTETNLNVEVGNTSSAYNKVKIDGKDGTLFNISPSLDETFYYRLSFIHKFNSPHGLRLLYAPLMFKGDKRFSKDINFGSQNFPAGEKTKAEYQFNSYRATYFYEMVNEENFNLRVGGTLKVRDAKIELKQDDRKKFKKNSGLVPLLYLTSEYKWHSGFRVALDFDGLAAPQGRAFDVAFMGGYNFSPSYQLNLGYRMLEGGVDNDEVYNFSQINYYFASINFKF